MWDGLLGRLSRSTQLIGIYQEWVARGLETYCGDFLGGTQNCIHWLAAGISVLITLMLEVVCTPSSVLTLIYYLPNVKLQIQTGKRSGKLF